MSAFALLILFKITLTTGLVALFVLAPTLWLNTLTGQAGTAPLIYRLYGTALAALIFAYAEAWRMSLSGTLPLALVAMGILSNGGAFVLLRRLATHPYMRASAWVFAAIASGLIIAALAPDQATVPLWSTEG